MEPSNSPALLTGLRCLHCGTVYAPGEVEYVCPCRPNKGSDLGHLDAEYDYDAAAASQGMLTGLDDAWPAAAARAIGRWWPLLPVGPGSLPPLPVGDTPFLRVDRLAGSLGMERLYVKDDARNPSASFKDRASAVALARAREAGYKTVATASTGNAAAALAALGAASGQETVIFLPAAAPRAKLAQLLVHGSLVLAVDGTYDDAFDLCVRACAAFGWYNRNTGYNPYTTEGKKTVSFEIAAQLAEQGEDGVAPGTGETGAGFRAPDSVFVSVGDGSIVGGVYKGFWELRRLGLIGGIPRIFGVQSTGSAAIHDAWREGRDAPAPVAAATVADSISVNAPRDAAKALRAARESGGAFLLAPDEAILQAIPTMARLGGVFAEPAGAAALAGLQIARQEGLIGSAETVVVINSGSGLKDVPAAMRTAGEPTVVAPRLDAVAGALRGRRRTRAAATP